LNQIAKNKTQEQLLKIISEELNQSSSPRTKVIAFVGGVASGKSTITSKLRNALERAEVLSTDDYVVKDRKYRHKYLDKGNPLKKYRPEVLNEHIQKIKKLKQGQSLMVPDRDEKTGIALDVGEDNFPKKIPGPVDYLIIEGDFQLVKNPDYIIYLDVPDEIRKINRVERDLKKRNMGSEKAIIENFELRQKNQHIPYTEPVKKIADMVIEAKTEKRSKGGFNYLYNIYLKKNG